MKKTNKIQKNRKILKIQQKYIWCVLKSVIQNIWCVFK